MKKHLLLITVFLCLFLPAAASAQESPELRLSLTKDLGYALGGSIQGTFSYHVSGPDGLSRVDFLMDGKSIGEDNEAPFRWQFKTDNFSLGTHTMSAMGYTVDGRTLQSNTIQRQFVSGRDSNQMEFWIIIPIIVLAIGGRIITGWITNRGSKQTGQPAINGPFGGTLCPKCGRPFAMHIWGLNVVVGKYDRCPHCGKWSLVRRASSDALHSAAETFLAENQDLETTPPPTNDSQSLSKQLDESRFDNL